MNFCNLRVTAILKISLANYIQNFFDNSKKQLCLREDVLKMEIE